MKVENVKVYDLEDSIKASKYPMTTNTSKCNDDITNTVKLLGSSNKGEGHDQWLTGVRVAFDLTFSNKAWIELERYRFIEFVSSQSTMHRITNLNIREQCNKYVWDSTIEKLELAVEEYNMVVDDVGGKDKDGRIADKYLEILYNIPSGFQITARLTTNYRALKTVYDQRKSHKLPEWREFCDWIETLPHFKELCLGGNKC
ncbi:MAG: hypothetical protein RSA29_17060 [Clostridium sp.]|uniref:hypothetical protein n=1 Tax=Clostridium sp. TaxID=1506 RepID=UPI00306C87F9